MRFLFLNWRCPENPKAGGAEQSTLQYASALAKRGHYVEWFSPNYDRSDECLTEYVGPPLWAPCSTTIDGVRIARGSTSSLFRSQLEARCLYKGLRYDLVVDQHHGVPWFTPLWSPTNSVSYIHEVLGHSVWGSRFNWPISALGAFQERLVLRRIYKNHVFLTVSDSTAFSLRNLGLPSRRLPNGHSMPCVSAPRPPTTPTKLITISRLEPSKQVDDAIRSLQWMPPQYTLTVVGDGSQLNTLKAIAHETGVSRRVDFVGRVSEFRKQQLLDESDLLIQTSVREGWGINVAEAAARGVPTIGYSSPGLRDSIPHFGGALMFPSPAAIPGAVCISPDFYAYMSSLALDRARENTWDKVTPTGCDTLELLAATRT